MYFCLINSIFLFYSLNQRSFSLSCLSLL